VPVKTAIRVQVWNLRSSFPLRHATRRVCGRLHSTLLQSALSSLQLPGCRPEIPSQHRQLAPPRSPECPGYSTAPDSMHPFSILTLGIFVAGYITARWDLVTRLYELAIFAWNYGVVVSGHRTPSPLHGAMAKHQRQPSNQTMSYTPRRLAPPKASPSSVSSSSSSSCPSSGLQPARGIWYAAVQHYALPSSKPC
jgi:phosphatidylinositol glycan class Q protein